MPYWEFWSGRIQLSSRAAPLTLKHILSASLCSSFWLLEAYAKVNMWPKVVKALYWCMGHGAASQRRSPDMWAKSRDWILRRLGVRPKIRVSHKLVLRPGWTRSESQSWSMPRVTTWIRNPSQSGDWESEPEVRDQFIRFKAIFQKAEAELRRHQKTRVYNPGRLTRVNF